jgi:hypothetical protein
MCTKIASVCTTSLIMAKFSKRGDKDKCYSILYLYLHILFLKSVHVNYVIKYF